MSIPIYIYTAVNYGALMYKGFIFIHLINLPYYAIEMKHIHTHCNLRIYDEINDYKMLFNFANILFIIHFAICVFVFIILIYIISKKARFLHFNPNTFRSLSIITERPAEIPIIPIYDMNNITMRTNQYNV